MEVEARPPALRDGKLGYSTQDEDNLRLTVSDGEELPSDEEQELLKSPVKERLQPVNGTTAGSTEETLDDSCETLNFENKCNGLERVDAYRTKRVKSVGDDISVREENDERTNHAIEGVGQVAAGDLKAINGLSRPKIVVDATGDVELGAEHVEAEDEDSSLPTVVNVACLGENDIGDCPMVLAATSLPLQGIELAGSEAILDAADGPSETRNTAALSAMEADEEELETLEEESHSETANELLDEEPTNVDSINSSQALGEETGDFRSEESTAHIAITDSGEVSIDGTMDNADEDIDAADTEMENDQGEGSDSPGYQGMAEDILPIIESELDPELDGQPEGGASYDTEFERPDDESGCLDAEDENPNDEVIADDISIHESEDSRMATDVSVGPQITGGAPFNESEDSRTDCEPAHASNDSRLSSPSNETKTSQSEAESAAREMVGGKPEGMDTSKQLHSAVGELEESEKSGDTVDATASSGLLELLLCKKTVRRRASSGNQHDAPPPMKIRRLSSLEGPEEGSKTLSEFKNLSTKEKPDSSKLELKPELTATHQNSVDIDLKRSKPVKVDIDVDEKKNAVLLIVDAEETKTEIKTPSIETPVRRTGNDCALDALFNGKDEITLSRKTFIKMMKSYVSQYMTTYNSFGKQGMRTAVKAEDSYNKVGSQISCYEKQKEDMKMVMKKLLDDREASKQWDPSVVPAKTTRSVGLQVSTVGSIYVSKNAEVHDPASKRVSTLPNPNNAMMQQKIAYAQQQQATAATKAQNTNRPTAKKSTTATTNTQLARSGPSRIATSPINRIVGNLKTAMPGQHLQQLNGVKTMLPKTTDPLALMRSSNTTLSPNGKTFLISAKKNVVPTAKAPAPVRATINPALMRALGSAMSSPASTTGKSQIIHTPNRNVAPGPGRPIVRTPSTVPVPTAVTPQTAKKASSLKAPVQATIDLTDDDGPQASKTNPGTNALGLRKLIPVPPKILPAPAPKQYKHPALPSNPPNFNALTAPPKPYLGICDTQEGTQGIMLTWHFNQAKPHMKVAKFQVFAYQESKSGAEDAWKKVGDVDALPLPMACTLTQFREGYTYHFIVRAVDELGNIGPFSAPNTITLVKRT